MREGKGDKGRESLTLSNSSNIIFENEEEEDIGNGSEVGNS